MAVCRKLSRGGFLERPELIEQQQDKAEQYGRERTRRDWKITEVLYLGPVGDYYDWREGVLRKAP